MTLVVSTRIHKTDYEATTKELLSWAKANESRYVCVANVHMVMEAYDSRDFEEVVNRADLVTPDGMPLVWVLRLKGQHEQQRVYGPTLLLYALEAAARENIPVGFYGGTSEVLTSLIKKMQSRYENLNVALAISPPFRSMSVTEDALVVEQINRSGARILFVGLGCPKQERWMAAHRGRVKAVMLGVGAAFDFHAGVKPQAPAWLQTIGLEWFFRLLCEPRRLWRRYLVYNPRFAILAILDLLGQRRT